MSDRSHLRLFDHNEARRLHHTCGLCGAEIARLLGVSSSSVTKVLRQPVVPVEVPAWVPRDLHDAYLELGEHKGEEAAAAHCRRLKATRRNIKPKSVWL